MYTLIINGLSNKPFTITNYSRNTTFDLDDKTMNSVAYFDIENTNNSTIGWVQEIAQNQINHILIKRDDTSIYLLSNITANITAINEYLQGDNISISVTLSFN